MNYSRLIKRIIGDGARTNKFTVRFNDLGDYARDLNFICVSSKLPSIQTVTADYKYKGHTVVIPVGAKYSSDWSADFYVDENHSIIKFFSDWIESYDTRGENISMSGKPFSYASIPNGERMTDFTCTVDIEQYPFDSDLLHSSGSPSAKYRLYNVFPISMQDIMFDENDTIEKLNVTFKYSYYERLGNLTTSNYTSEQLKVGNV